MQNYPPNMVSVPYHIIHYAEQQPMLQGNSGSKHPTGYQNSKDQGWFLWIATRISSLLGVVSIAMAIVWASMLIFTDSDLRRGYETSTFLLSSDKLATDSWQVLAQSTWSDLSKPNPTIDTQFNHYFECWHAAGMGWTYCDNASVSDYKTCITARYSSTLTTCANTTDPNYIPPSLNAYTSCINRALLPSRQSLNGLEICLRTNPWPLYEAPQDVDSLYFLGSYNWMLMLIIGFGLFACFVLFTGGFVIMAENVTPGESGQINGPVSYGISAVCTLFALLFFMYFVTVSYRLNGSYDSASTTQLPNSVATIGVLLPASVIVLAYFLMETIELWFKSYPSSKKDDKEGSSKTAVPFNIPKNAIVVSADMMNLASHTPHYFDNRNPGQTWKSKMVYYYPALTLAWADAYVLDTIMTVGIIGSTLQVSTATVYQIFLTLFAYRWAHTALARFLYEGYITNPDENPKNFSKPSYASNLYTIRMQGMFTHLAAIVCLVMAWYVITNTNIMLSEYTMVVLTLYLWYIIPELIRFMSHILVAFRATSQDDRGILITSNYIIWIWDVLVRLIWVIIFFWGASNIHGSQYFLKERLYNITETITYMTA